MAKIGLVATVVTTTVASSENKDAMDIDTTTTDTDTTTVGGAFKIEKLKCSKLCHYTSCNYRYSNFFDLISLLMSLIAS